MIGYYSHRDVRARMLEFLGGDSLQHVTCRFLTGGDTLDARRREPQLPEGLPDFWDAGREIRRSLWDRRSLLAHLEVEYVNFGSPVEPYWEPEHAFYHQRPVEWAIEAVLQDYGLAPLHLVGGQGHHFVWRLRRPSEVFSQLVNLGRVSDTLKKFYSRLGPPFAGQTVAEDWAAAFSGLGLVLEYVAHRVKEIADPMGEVPLRLAVTEGGPPRHGRAAVSINLSEYGEPLTAPVIHVPFSIDLQPWQRRSQLGEHTVENLPPIFLIPLRGMEPDEAIQIMRDVGRVTHLAGQVSTRIPDQSKAMENLVAAYRDSDLAQFHDWFYSPEHEPRAPGSTAGDATLFQRLPGCARDLLEHPNDRLLDPTGIEHIVRVLLALGWHPRQVAGLIRSKYEADFGWGDRWQGCEPGARADFLARVIAGLIAAGRDDLAGFDCPAARAGALCSQIECPVRLGQLRADLRDWRPDERLVAHR